MIIRWNDIIIRQNFVIIFLTIILIVKLFIIIQLIGFIVLQFIYLSFIVIFRLFIVFKEIIFCFLRISLSYSYCYYHSQNPRHSLNAPKTPYLFFSSKTNITSQSPYVQGRTSIQCGCTSTFS